MMMSTVLSAEKQEKPLVVKKKSVKKVKSANRNVAPKLSSMSNEFVSPYIITPTPPALSNDTMNRRATSLLT